MMAALWATPVHAEVAEEQPQMKRDKEEPKHEEVVAIDQPQKDEEQKPQHEEVAAAPAELMKEEQESSHQDKVAVETVQEPQVEEPTQHEEVVTVPALSEQLMNEEQESSHHDEIAVQESHAEEPAQQEAIVPPVGEQEKEEIKRTPEQLVVKEAEPATTQDKQNNRTGEKSEVNKKARIMSVQPRHDVTVTPHVTSAENGVTHQDTTPSIAILRPSPPRENDTQTADRAPDATTPDELLSPAQGSEASRSHSDSELPTCPSPEQMDRILHILRHYRVRTGLLLACSAAFTATPHLNEKLEELQDLPPRKQKKEKKKKKRHRRGSSGFEIVSFTENPLQEVADKKK